MAIYYVDQTGGDDSKAGTAVGTAWKTISKVNGSSFSADDQVLFKKGEVWRETLTVSSSGTSGHPVIFSTYGSGASPIINGSDLVTTWADDTGNRWKATVTTEPKIVMFNGVRGTHVASEAACDADKKWYWAANVLYTFGTVNPNTTYPSQIEAGARDYSLVLSLKSYLTFTGITICQSNHSAIWFQGASHVTLDGLTLTNNFYHGNNNYHAGGQNSQYLIVRNCTLTYNGGDGFTINDNGVTDAMSHVLIEKNIVHHNGWNNDESDYAKWCAGIKIYGSNNNDGIIQDNEVYSNYAGSTASGMGIWVDTWGTGAIVRRNKVHDNALRGIMIEITGGAEVSYNLSYNNVDAGIALMSYTTTPPVVSGNHVYNNTSYGNGIGIQLYAFYNSAGMIINNLVKNNICWANTRAFSATGGGQNDGTYGSGNVYAYNCFGPEGSNYIEWGAGAYKSTIATFNAVADDTTGGGNNISSNPRFVSASTSDFHLQGDSLCMNAGANVGLTTDYDGVTITGLPDMGAYEAILTAQGSKTYYFAITAFDNAGGESAFSSEVSWTVPDYGTITGTLVGNNSIVGTSAGSCVIQGVTWNVGALVGTAAGLGLTTGFAIANKAGALAGFLQTAGAATATIGGSGRLANTSLIGSSTATATIGGGFGFTGIASGTSTTTAIMGSSSVMVFAAAAGQGAGVATIRGSGALTGTAAGRSLLAQLVIPRFVGVAQRKKKSPER
jgi:hypothetical protein